MMKKAQKSLSEGTVSDSEYAEFYAGYINLSRGEDLFKRLENGAESMNSLIESLEDEKALFRYRPDKWSVKEIIGHMIDTERIMGFRALTFARGEGAHIPGYDHQEYVDAADFDSVELNQFQDDYNNVRASTISLFNSFSDDMLLRTGTASGCTFSVRALGYIIAGHELHHLNILRERYLPEL